MFKPRTNISENKSSSSNSFLGVQAKLNIGKSDDKYEREADQMADKVVNNPGLLGTEAFIQPSHAIQKKRNDEQEAQKQEETEQIQEKPLLNEVTNLVQKQEEEISSTQNRPKWNEVYEGYPKNDSGADDMDAVSVFESILGDNYDDSIFTNACATRVSLGLLSGGMVVKRDFLIQKGNFRGRGFVASAINLKNWLSRSSVWGDPDEKIEGPSDIVAVKNTIGNRNGVYIIIGGFGGGVSGHATLWVGSQRDAFGGHNYVSYGGDVYFWELT